MAKELHLYMAGNDPFILTIGGTTIFVHTGLPDTVPDPPDPSPEAADGAPVISVPPDLKPPIGTFVVAPETSDELRDFVDAHDVSEDLGLAVEAADFRQLAIVLRGIEAARSDRVAVHLVVANPSGRRG